MYEDWHTNSTRCMKKQTYEAPCKPHRGGTKHANDLRPPLPIYPVHCTTHQNQKRTATIPSTAKEQNKGASTEQSSQPERAIVPTKKRTQLLLPPVCSTRKGYRTDKKRTQPLLPPVCSTRKGYRTDKKRTQLLLPPVCSPMHSCTSSAQWREPIPEST